MWKSLAFTDVNRFAFLWRAYGRNVEVAPKDEKDESLRTSQSRFWILESESVAGETLFCSGTSLLQKNISEIVSTNSEIIGFNSDLVFRFVEWLNRMSLHVFRISYENTIE